MTSVAHEQDRDIVQRFLAGESQSQIARELGLTRERVRQRLERNGYRGRNNRWMTKADRARDLLKTVQSLEKLLNSLGLNDAQWKKVVEQHGLHDDWRLTKKRWRAVARESRILLQQQPAIANVRAVAVRVGHTPTQNELEESGIYHAELARLFGSASQAMVAAGLAPNQAGRLPMPLPDGFGKIEEPTHDLVELLQRAEQLRRARESFPDVKRHPKFPRSRHLKLPTPGVTPRVRDA
jgi:hypothetical protein